MTGAPDPNVEHLRRLAQRAQRHAEWKRGRADKSRPWFDRARPKQLPPDDPRHHLPDAKGYRCGCDGEDGVYNVWLIMAGRGFGKTLTGSQWVVAQAVKHPKSEWGVLAPTFRDVRKTCIEGETGILRALQPGELANYRRNELQLVLSNGSVVYGYSADQPERTRGANLWGAWADEICSWRYPQTWYEGLVPALRIGEHPRVVVTTTPRPTALIRDLVGRADGSVHVTRGSTWENENLSATAVSELRHRYEGTRLGRQELEGELLADLEGALWTRDVIDRARVRPSDLPDLTRVVVAIDPAVTSKAASDETGIVVAGEDGRGHGYVLADLSVRASPDAWMRKAVGAFRDHKADRMVGEANNGGDFLETLLRTVDSSIPFKKVHASRGKAVRAEPVAALYEQLRIHHVGVFPELEDQMCSWDPSDPRVGNTSPDRVDALVWAFTELKGLSSGSWHELYGTRPCEACGRSFLADVDGRRRGKCPHCGKPLGPGDDGGTPPPAAGPAGAPPGPAPAASVQIPVRGGLAGLRAFAGRGFGR